MSPVTDTDLREIRDLILNLDKKLDVFMARTDERLNAVDQRITTLDTSLNKRIDSLDTSLNKRIDSLENRANGQETRFWGLVALLATALLGIIGKVVFFPKQF